MASTSWTGVSGDWTEAADWSGGVVPGAGDAVTLGGTAAYTLTLYTATPVGSVVMNAANALFYDAGALTLIGVFSLQAGTFALAYGSLIGGTLALAGGTLAAEGGTLNGVAVQGSLNLSQAYASLLVQNGLTMSGIGGSGAGSITLTGSYANLNFLGTQILANAVVTLGATGAGQGQGGPATLGVAQAYGATSGSTLTLAANAWLREAGTQGQIITSGSLPSPYISAVINKGTITAAAAGSTLTISGAGIFSNQGTLSVSNGATLDIASAGFTNAGTLVVNNATLDFGGTIASSLLGNLGAFSLTQATVEIGGTVLNSGATLSVGSATPLGPLELAGTITGGTVLDSGGGLNLVLDTGALNGVTYNGTLTLGAGSALTLLGNTTLTYSGGGAGTAAITGTGAALLLEGVTTLDNATLSLGSNSGAAASLGTADSWLASTATTATLGPHLTITQAGKFAAIDANATTPIQGYGLADTLVNQGTIAGGFSGGTLALAGYGTLINQGSIVISNGDTLVVDPALFANTGTIDITGGAVATLGGPTNVFGQAPIWTNTGLVAVNGGTLTLAGAMRSAQLGDITSSGGSLILAGTLANTGSTLTLGNAGQLPGLSLTGTIQGGTISDAGGLLGIGAAGTALLNGVTDIGTLNLTQSSAWLSVRNSLTLVGAANVTGLGAVLAFSGTQTFDKAQVNLGAATGAALDVLQDPSSNTPSTLTLGPSLAIVQAGALAAIGAASDAAGDGIIDFGAIAAAINGGTFSLAGAGFTNRGSIAVSNGDTLALTTGQFSNAGTVAVSNAALAIRDSVSIAALGQLQLNNAAISVAGTLSASGGTLAIGAGSAWGRISLTGTIAGGAILDTGSGLNAAGGATLSGVTYEGVLDLSRPFQQLNVANGIALTDVTGTHAGTILLTGAASRLLASTSETLANATIYLGSPSETYMGQRVPPPELDAGAGTTLTLAGNTLLRSAGAFATLGNCSLGNWTDTIVNYGTVLESAAGGTMTIGCSFFSNAGGLVIGNAGSDVFSGVAFTNTNAGAISMTGGSALTLSLYGYYAAPDAGATIFSNSGTVHMLGGMLIENTGGGLFPAVPMANLPGGLIQGFGNVVGPLLNNATIEAKYGPNLDLAGTITGAGALQIDPGCVLELGSAVASTQTVSFTAAGETLRLDAPAGFAASVANFASGDSIDSAGAQVNTVAISAGTLVLGTSYGVFKLNSITPLGGAISVGSDHHSGDTVLYTAQSNGGSPTILAVGQPKMLFWASPLGDEFQGASTNINGAEIANWTTTDSLDFVDFLGTKTTVAYSQATGQGTITVTCGSQSAAIGLLGTYTASWFHVSSDGHGGALVTYTHP